jgi:DNA-binding NarL/FixJ family response regulator
MQKKKVVLVDDHNLVRVALKAVIQRDPEFTVIAEARDADEGLHILLQSKPDVAIVDISLPGRSGLDLLREIRARLPRTRIFVVSIFSRPDVVSQALEAGALGYVTKNANPETILQALRSVSEGQYYVEGAVSREVLVAEKDGRPRLKKSAASDHGVLSRREREVLRLIADGKPPRQIGQILSISVKTVANHRTNLLAKLGLRTNADLVKYAVRVGLSDATE